MAMTIARSRITALAVLVVGTALAYGVLVGRPKPAPEPAPTWVPPLVDIVYARPQPQALAVQTQGTVHPHREIQLVSQVSGMIEQVSPAFAQGGFFEAGDSLVKVEDVDYRFAIARAESQVAASKQVVAEEEGRALQARREWRDLGSVQANDLFLRKPQIASAKASLKAAEADLAAARLDLERTTITAPFNGRIREKLVDVGQFISPGTPVASIYGTDLVDIRLPLTDRQVALLQLPLTSDSAESADVANPSVTVRARFGNREWQWEGQVVRTDAVIDLDSRVVYAVAEVERPFESAPDSQRPPLSPGLFVHATIAGRTLEGVTALPRSALDTDGQVMIVDEQGLARTREVQVLQSDARHAWVQGLDDNEHVIVGQHGQVIAGMGVEIRAEQTAAQGEP